MHCRRVLRRVHQHTTCLSRDRAKPLIYPLVEFIAQAFIPIVDGATPP
jgi:hypothetical protein